MGDAAGIGPEVSLRALREPSVRAACTPVIFGDAGVLRRVARQCHLAGPERVISLEQWRASGGRPAPEVVDCGAIDAESVVPGKVQAACGQAAARYIEAAVASALAGKAAAVTTGPINKEALRAAGVPYPGHTEMLAALTGASSYCMMLASEVLTVSMVTTHIGYRDVPARLSQERILEVIELTADANRRRLDAEPRIGVCGLNPHAGEHGLFGDREEEKFIEPAIQAAVRKGIHAEGPLPPDTAFAPAVRKRFDAYVTMYHDQGHIPFKMLAFDTGVNITLGLPIVRTSVDHGTAFDIAWTGRASATSMMHALDWAVRLAGRSQRG